MGHRDFLASASLALEASELCLLIPELPKPDKRTMIPNANLPSSQVNGPVSF